MKYLIAILILFPVSLMAEKIDPEPYCKKVPAEKMFNVLQGKFEVIGKTEEGLAYSGELVVSKIGESFVIEKLVNDKKIKGEAWVESCSPDKFKRLVVKYKPDSLSSIYSCYLRGDGDNFLRSSCKSFDNRSLEAWYQSDEIMP
jgi:hypothetical protein